MNFHFIAFFLFFGFTTGQDGCSICGDGKGVNNSDAIFAFPGQPAVPCGTLEIAGQNGLIPISQCSFLAALVPMCDCVPLSDLATPDPTSAPINLTPSPTLPPTAEPTVNPTPNPTAEPTTNPTPLPTARFTPAPVPAVLHSICESIPSNGCSVCGDGKYVSDPVTIFEFPGQPAVPCGVLELAGETGAIPIGDCSVLPSVITSVCGCVVCEGAETGPPSAESTPNPTSPPTLEPTNPPTPEPTNPPTPEPTIKPTSFPTNLPTSIPSEAPSSMPVPVAPTPFPVLLFTPAPTEDMMNVDNGGKKSKKSQKKEGSKSNTSAKKDKAARRYI